MVNCVNGLGWQSRKEKQIINNENGFKSDKWTYFLLLLFQIGLT